VPDAKRLKNKQGLGNGGYLVIGNADVAAVAARPCDHGQADPRAPRRALVDRAPGLEHARPLGTEHDRKGHTVLDAPAWVEELCLCLHGHTHAQRWSGADAR